MENFLIGIGIALAVITVGLIVLHLIRSYEKREDAKAAEIRRVQNELWEKERTKHTADIVKRQREYQQHREENQRATERRASFGRSSNIVTNPLNDFDEPTLSGNSHDDWGKDEASLWSGSSSSSHSHSSDSTSHSSSSYDSGSSYDSSSSCDSSSSSDSGGGCGCD
jgi:hypothetical protein